MCDVLISAVADTLDVSVIMPIKLFGLDFSITNSALAMVFVTASIIVLLLFCTKKVNIKPNKAQVIIEQLFFFVGNIVGSKLKSHSVALFPYMMALFLFILFGNVFGLFPFAFSFTSQIVITIAMASAVFLASIILGFVNHGIHYLRHFCPKEIPIYIAPFFVIIELMSFLFRPISLGIRLFANMFSGHIMLEIVAGAAVAAAASASPFIESLSIVPIAINVLLDIFKLIVCVLQSYVFVVLSCEYLSESFSTENADDA